MIVGIVPTGTGIIAVENQFFRADTVADGVDAYVNGYKPPRDPADYLGFDTGWTEYTYPAAGKVWAYDRTNLLLVQEDAPPSAGSFGDNFQQHSSLARSTTTSDVFQDKGASLTTGNDTRFFVQWSALMDNSRAQGEARLFNVTDGVVVGETNALTNQSASDKRYVGGMAMVGPKKELQIQYRDVSGGKTQGIQDAMLVLWCA